jgi:hypothetical protein
MSYNANGISAAKFLEGDLETLEAIIANPSLIIDLTEQLTITGKKRNNLCFEDTHFQFRTDIFAPTAFHFYKLGFDDEIQDGFSKLLELIFTKKQPWTLLCKILDRWKEIDEAFEEHKLDSFRDEKKQKGFIPERYRQPDLPTYELFFFARFLNFLVLEQFPSLIDSCVGYKHKKSSDAGTIIDFDIADAIQDMRSVANPEDNIKMRVAYMVHLPDVPKIKELLNQEKGSNHDQHHSSNDDGYTPGP